MIERKDWGSHIRQKTLTTWNQALQKRFLLEWNFNHPFPLYLPYGLRKGHGRRWAGSWKRRGGFWRGMSPGITRKWPTFRIDFRSPSEKWDSKLSCKTKQCRLMAQYEHFNNVWSPFGLYQKDTLRTEIKTHEQLWSCKARDFGGGLKKIKDGLQIQTNMLSPTWKRWP